MKNCFSAFRPGLLAALIAAVVPAVSCYQSAQPPAPPPAPSDIGRFQVVVTAEGERGTVLFLLDTKEGGTWIYRPPQGAVVNGYWSDIPRLTYGAEFWQRAFSQMGQPVP
jgi:hypothetical protein